MKRRLSERLVYWPWKNHPGWNGALQSALYIAVVVTGFYFLGPIR